MHTLTIRTKYIFGDRVRFDSPTQRRSGTGTIRVITIDGEGMIDYMIEVDGKAYFQPGILEDEITYLEAD
jgi:hypothetical protein